MRLCAFLRKPSDGRKNFPDAVGKHPTLCKAAGGFSTQPEMETDFPVFRKKAPQSAEQKCFIKQDNPNVWRFDEMI